MQRKGKLDQRGVYQQLMSMQGKLDRMSEMVAQIQQQLIATSSIMGGAFQGFGLRFKEIESRLDDIKDDTRMRIVPEEHRTIKEQIDYVAAQLQVLKEAHVGLGRLIVEKIDSLALTPQFGQSYGFSLD